MLRTLRWNNTLIPRRKNDKDAPGLRVEPLTDRDAPVKVHFNNPEVQYIGTSGCGSDFPCGCDFPHAMFQNFGWSDLGYVEYLGEIEARQIKEALVALLRASGETVVELYGILQGEFAEPPEAQANIATEEILDPAFHFKERVLYKVAAERVNESLRFG